LTPLALCTLLAIAATGVACVDAPHEVGSGGEGPGGNGALVAGSSPGGAGSGNAGAAAGTSGGTTGVAGSAAAGAAPTAGSDSVAGAGSIAGASGSGTGSAGSGAGGSGGSGDTHWVGTWTASPYATASDGMPTGGLSLANSVLRQITHASLGGNQIRVQFSNKQGKEALVINAAHVALCKATPKVNGSIDTTTDKALAFSGKANVSVPAGQEIWSDPLDFALPALGNLTITTAFGTVPGALTSHNGSRTTSYIQTGTDVSAASMSAGGTTHWYFISAVDVMAPAAAKGIVAIGDSITDGRGVTVDGNDRWTDVLAARLQANPATANVSIMNQGIGATNLTGTDVTTAENRFARDVLGQSGVKYAIIYDGVNDINGGVDASVMKAVYAKLIKAGRDKGLLVYGGTITPCACARDSVRVEINTYIKSGAFDGVLDFDAALKDPTDPTHMLAAAGSTDNLHPGPAGYKMMADSVDLTLFTK
jgi:lysophospholipase L1-like esterase